MQHLGGISNGGIARSLNVSCCVSNSVKILTMTSIRLIKIRQSLLRNGSIDITRRILLKEDHNQGRNENLMCLTSMVVETIIDNPFSYAAVVGREPVHRDTVRKVWNDMLEDYIVERWERMRANPQYFENIYRSMPNRMRAVINNNGGPTKY